MRKIISLYQRNYDGDRRVRDEVVPGAEWVLEGEGVPTRKFDGTCCLVRDGRLFARYEVKKGKTPPANFEPATDVDPETGKQQGWVPVGDGPEHKYHREAFEQGKPYDEPSFIDGQTYELVGPKINNNPDRFPGHVLIRHGYTILSDAPRSYDALREYLVGGPYEGIVWHHPDGRMVKIKAKDFPKASVENPGDDT